MILEERTTPGKIKGYEAQLQRLNRKHEMYKVLEDQLYIANAGIGGEQEFDRVLKRHSFDMPHYFIHDLSLNVNTEIQIDSFFFTPYFGLMFEIKNLSGKLSFESNPMRIIQEHDDGKLRTITLNQLADNRYYLNRWFDQRDINIPIYTVFVLAYPKQIIIKSPEDLDVLYPSGVAQYIRSIKKPGNYLEEDEFKRIAEELVNEHREFQPFPMNERWGIKREDLITGVQCVQCKRFDMKKVRRGWLCNKCQFFSMNAHVKALEDYFMIVSDTITNTECRWFLQLDDRQVAKRILNSMKLKKVGKNKFMEYIYQYN